MAKATSPQGGTQGVKIGRLTTQEIEDGLKEAEKRAARVKAGKKIDDLTDLEKAFDKAHAKRVALSEKGAEKAIALNTKQIKKMTKIGLRDRIRVLGFREAVGKPALIGAGVIAGVAALGVLAMKIRGDRKNASKGEAMVAPEMDMLPPPMDMGMMGQNTMMGMEPAPGAYAQRVTEGRGGIGGPKLG